MPFVRAGGGPPSPVGSLPSVRAAVVCAEQAGGPARALVDVRRGLVLEGWPAAGGVPLPLGPGGFPRFRPDGRLVFETGEDDGHALLATEVRVLDPGRTVPRAATPGEDLGAWTPPPRDPPPSGVRRVCVDAGHGGADAGAVGAGLAEAEVALDVALRLAEWLETDNGDPSGGGAWEVLATRVDDRRVSLVERLTMIDAFAPACVVSLHATASTDPAATGTRTLAAPDDADSLALRDRVHARALQAWGLPDAGVDTSDDPLLALAGPSTARLVAGHLTHPTDGALLADPESRDRLALAVLFALQEHLGLTVHEPSLFTLLTGGTYGTIGKPALLASGPLTARSLVDVRVVDALPDAPAVLFVSTASIPTPFLGGDLYAFPVSGAAPLVVGGDGTLAFSASWPPDIPSGASLWFQLALVDPFVPVHGAVLSDALVATTP